MFIIVSIFMMKKNELDKRNFIFSQNVLNIQISLYLIFFFIFKSLLYSRWLI